MTKKYQYWWQQPTSERHDYDKMSPAQRESAEKHRLSVMESFYEQEAWNSLAGAMIQAWAK